jgi:hypothetical protein
MQEEFDVCHLPYIGNLKPFLDWMKVQIQENPMYTIASNTTFEADTIREILHSWMIDPTKPTIRHKRNGEQVRTFETIDYDVFKEAFNLIVEGEKYAFIETDDSHYTPELLEYIKYAMVESMVCDFFQTARKEIFKYHNDTVGIIWQGLCHNEAYPGEKLCEVSDKIVPEDGKASTKAGEFMRAIGKIVYHIANDGDNPSNYAARQAQFWSMVHCYNTIISSNANYKLFLSIITEEEKKRCRGCDYSIYFSSEIDDYTIINLANFALAYVETAEGKEENEIDCIKPIHKNIDWYDGWIPRFENLYND